MKETAHRWLLRTRVMPWRYCCRCGLIALNNRATERAIKRPCPASEDE